VRIILLAILCVAASAPFTRLRAQTASGVERSCSQPSDPTKETPATQAALAARCRAHLARHPDDVPAYRVLGGALINQPAAALAAYEEGLQKAPTDPVLMLNAGLQLERLGRHREAIGRFERAAVLLPGDAVPLIQAGLAAQSLPDHELAIWLLRQAIVRRPHDGGAWGYLARSFAAQGQHDSAVTAWDRAERSRSIGFIDEAGDREAYENSRRLIGPRQKTH
jgi:tetratricopeptide (TPR) repeat protein